MHFYRIVAFELHCFLNYLELFKRKLVLAFLTAVLHTGFIHSKSIYIQKTRNQLTENLHAKLFLITNNLKLQH